MRIKGTFKIKGKIDCLFELERKFSDECEAYNAFVADGGDPDEILEIERHLGITYGP